MKMVTKKIGLLLFLLVGLFTQMQAQTFAVNSNLLLLSTQTYNLGAEITVGNHTTLGLSVFGNNKPYFHKGMRAIGVQPEFKYYFGGRPMYHHYVGIGLLAADYSITWGNRKYDGTAWGGGHLDMSFHCLKDGILTFMGELVRFFPTIKNLWLMVMICC